MSERVEYVTTHYFCEGCGDEVFAYGMHKIPNHGFCSVCHWLDTYQRGDLKEFWEIYTQVSGGKR